MTKKQLTDSKAEKLKARADAFKIGGSHVQKSQGLGARVSSGDENEEEEDDLENPVPHTLQAMTAAHAAAKGGPGGKPLKKDKSRGAASNKKANVPLPKISKKGSKVDKKKKHSGKKRKKSDDNDDPSEASDEDEDTSSDESQDYKVLMKEATRQIRENGRAPKLSRTRMKEIINTKGAEIDDYLCKELKKKQWFSITTDGWTSKSHHSYYATTVHYIDDEDFEMVSFPLSIKVHEGTAKAEDHLRFLKEELAKHGLSLENVVSMTTDTESTMNSFGRMVQEEARQNNGNSIKYRCASSQLLL